MAAWFAIPAPTVCTLVVPAPAISAGLVPTVCWLIIAVLMGD